MPRFSLRVEGLHDERFETPVELDDAAAAECAAIQMLAELRINAARTAHEGVRRVAVYDDAGAPVLDVTLTVFRPSPRR